eukprot:gene4958-4856_t
MTLFFFIAGYFARLMHQRLGARAFWLQRAQRIGVPLVVGWILIFPVLAVIWHWGAMKLAGGAPPVAVSPFEGFGAFPLIHLWFLYQLLWLYAGALLLRGLIVRLDRGESLRKALDRVTTGALRWPLGALLLGLPLAACLMSLPTWVPQAGIPTPDRSLIPLLPASVGYGMAFAFGWLVHRAPHALITMRQSWVSHLCLALFASLTCLTLLGAHPGVAMPSQIKQMFTLAFVVSTWAWSFALTGLALRFLAGHSTLIRYLADASYWIYLTHLPLVTAMQVWVSTGPLHWGLKFPFILLASLALLLLSYHFLVRSTAIGEVLNARHIDDLISSNGDVRKSRHDNFFSVSDVFEDANGIQTVCSYFVFMSGRKVSEPNQEKRIRVYVESAYPETPNVPHPDSVQSRPFAAVLGDIWAEK